MLQRFEYRRLARSERGVVLAYLQRLSGYGRAQITRLVARWVSGKPLVKHYAAPRQAFARRYTLCRRGLAGRGQSRHGHAVGLRHGLRVAPPARRLC